MINLNPRYVELFVQALKEFNAIAPECFFYRMEDCLKACEKIDDEGLIIQIDLWFQGLLKKEGFKVQNAAFEIERYMLDLYPDLDEIFEKDEDGAIIFGMDPDHDEGRVDIEFQKDGNKITDNDTPNDADGLTNVNWPLRMN